MSKQQEQKTNNSETKKWNKRTNYI